MRCAEARPSRPAESRARALTSRAQGHLRGIASSVEPFLTEPPRQRISSDGYLMQSKLHLQVLRGETAAVYEALCGHKKHDATYVSRLLQGFQHTARIALRFHGWPLLDPSWTH